MGMEKYEQEGKQEKTGKEKFIKVLTFLMLSTLVLFIGYLFIFPVNQTNEDVTSYLEKELGVQNVVLLQEAKFGSETWIGGRFVLFSYGDGTTYGKATFTTLKKRMKINEQYLNIRQEEVHIMKVNGKHYRVIAVLNPRQVISKVNIREGEQPVQTFEAPKPYTVISYPITEAALTYSVGMEFFDANGGSLPQGSY